MSSRTISGVTFTVNADGTIGINGTSTGTCFLNPNTKYNKAYLQKIPAGTYRLDFESAGLGIFLFGFYEDGSETPIVYAGNTVTYARDAYVGPQIRIAAGATVNTIAQLMLHTGTSKPNAYAGWENIRPIKGRDSVTVERCGENLLNITPFSKLTNKGITFEYVATGGMRISGTSTVTAVSPIFAIRHLPPGEYFGVNTDTGVAASVVVQRNGSNLWLNAKGVFKILAGDVVKYWCASVGNGITVNTTVYPYIIPGTTAPTAYSPYTGQTSTLALPHTIYGGEVDAVTGEGQETWKVLNILSASYIEGGSGGGWTQSEDAVPWYIYKSRPDSGATKILSNIFRPISSIVGTAVPYTIASSPDFIAFRLPRSVAATEDDVRNWLIVNDAEIIFESKAKTLFTATGAQPIPALNGVNTVLTDADSVAVTGRADPIKRITDLEDAVASMT